MYRINRRPRRYYVNKCTIILAVCVSVIFLTTGWILSDEEIVLGDGTLDISEYELYVAEIDDDFPVDDENTYKINPRIPRIIHQTWKNHHVPSSFQDNVRSFVDLNPEYEYMYWTDDSARKLIAERHEELLQTFDNYAEPVRKADMLR